MLSWQLLAAVAVGVLALVGFGGCTSSASCVEVAVWWRKRWVAV